jgi:Domain of unknown function (DUF4123)
LHQQLIDEGLLALRAAAGSRPLAIFVDPTLSTPAKLHDEWQLTLNEAKERGAAKWFRLGHIHDNFDPQRHPGLVYLTSEQSAERLVAASLQIGFREALRDYGEEHRDRCLCGWILDVHDPQTLRAELTALARVVKPDGHPWYLRYWDPRVSWQLERVLSPQHLQRVRQAMGQWWSIGPLNKLAHLGSDLAEHGLGITAPPPQSPGALRFDESQWNTLLRVGTVNAVLQLAEKWNVLPTKGNAKQADDLVRRCRMWGFETEQDPLVFAACAMTSHLHFDEHPIIHAALRKAADARSSVQTAVADIDDALWTELATGGWHTHPTDLKDV